MKKQCFKCGGMKALSEFYKHPQMKDGHLNKCKECTKRDTAERQASFTPEEQVAERKRHREKSRRYRAEGRDNTHRLPGPINPARRRANSAVARAIRNGTLHREPCKVCGREPTHGHHEDYSKPLDVTWLCVRHHNERHFYLGDQAVLKKKPLSISAWIRRIRSTLKP